MPNQVFQRCKTCNRGKLTLPDIFCLNCQPDPRIQILECAELDLENGIINEGKYLEICEKLKQK
jgi:hypothetical protein